MNNFRETMALSPIVNCVSDDDETNSKIGSIVGSFALAAAAGSLVSGMAADKWGRRVACIIGAAFYTAGAAMEATSQNVGSMVLGRVSAGVGVGFLSCVVPMYISEMAPARVRGTLVSLQQLMLTLGILVAFVVNAATESNEKGESRERQTTTQKRARWVMSIFRGDVVGLSARTGTIDAPAWGCVGTCR